MIGLGLAINSVGQARFSPLTVPNLQWWWDPSDSATIYQSSGGALVGADSDPVGELRDKSGRGKHLGQTDGTKKPAYRTNIKNGKSVIRFDGSNDILQLAEAGLWPTGYQHTLFVVFQTSTTGANQIVIDSGADSLASRRLLSLTAAGTALSCGRDVANSMINTTFAANTWYVCVRVFNGSSGYFKVNGASTSASASETTSTLQSASPLTVGRRFTDTAASLNGDIGDILMYSGALDSTTVGQIETYLKGKWGISY